MSANLHHRKASDLSTATLHHHCIVSVCEMCDPDFATSQEEKEGQATVTAAPTMLACQKLDGHLCFLGGEGDQVAQSQCTPVTWPWAGRTHTGPTVRATEANEVSRSEWRWSTRRQMEALMHLARCSARRRIPVALILGPSASLFGSRLQKKKSRKNGHSRSYGGRLRCKRSAAKWAFFCTEPPPNSPRLLIYSLARYLQRVLNLNRRWLTSLFKAAV